jgi:hypothetical protein
LEGQVKIDLGQLTETVLPFVPAAVPKLSGEILLQTSAQLQTDQKINFDLTLSCKDILAAEGPLKEKNVGPFSLILSRKAM